MPEPAANPGDPRPTSPLRSAMSISVGHPLGGVLDPIAVATVPASEPTLAIDPLADLLFGVVAIVVLAVIVILPTVNFNSAPKPGTSRFNGESMSSTSFRLDNRPVEPLIATARGLRTGPSPSDFIPLERILDDKGLAAKLMSMRDRREPLVLLIDPDGDEAAFQFEAVASLNGPPRIRQIRLDTGCAYAKSQALIQYCLAQSNQSGTSAR
jgi:hypothetical protein